MTKLENINDEFVLVVHWRVQDVMRIAYDIGESITVNEAQNVLLFVSKSYDPDKGINRQVIEFWIDQEKNGKTR